MLDEVRGWYWDDPVSAMYREMFSDDVIVDISLEEAELKTDVFFRQVHKVPPGYKDAGKDVGFAGDLIIWRTILEIGRTRKSHLVFVSGEEKADWWYRASEGVLYPRFELVDEYRRASEGRTFHITRLADLLAEFGAKPEVVEAVREEEAAARPTVDIEAHIALVLGALRAVRQWLSAEGEVRSAGDRTMVRRSDGTEIAASVLIVEDAYGPFNTVRARIASALKKLSDVKHALIVLVARDSADARTLFHRVRRHYQRHESLPSDGAIVVGYVVGGEFSPFASYPPSTSRLGMGAGDLS